MEDPQRNESAWTDEIVAGVRSAREELLAACDYDLKKLGKRLRETQEASDRAVVTFPRRIAGETGSGAIAPLQGIQLSTQIPAQSWLFGCWLTPALILLLVSRCRPTACMLDPHAIACTVDRGDGGLISRYSCGRASRQHEAIRFRGHR